MKRSLRKWLLCLCSAALVLSQAGSRAQEIANSIAEFSGTQGQDGWNYGYRLYTEGEPNNYDPAAAFLEFTPEMWTGGGWDVDPVGGEAPWTTMGAEALHPNGSNSGEIHWPIRRWTADELAAGTTPIAITWRTRKQNTGGNNGVTGFVFQNGVKIDSASIAGTDGTGVTRTYYVNAAKGDKFDLVLSPAGADGVMNDGADGSFNSMVVSTTMPAAPRQPNGAYFIPAGSADTDADGLADFWENNFVPGDLTAMNGTGDRDSDGLTNRQEHDAGLDPTNADNDGDGLRDGVETKTGTYVSATDTGTDPLVADSDGDGRTDGAEVNGPITSNPTDTDSDDDTFTDGQEVASGHNPTNAENNPNTTPIANSQAEFSGVQGQDGWLHGYRPVTGDGAITDYGVTEFVPFPGGDQGAETPPWDGTAQVWTGTIWDLNTAAAGPWTELGALGTHPSGPSPLHWVVRRWTVSGLTGTQPVALTYFVRKANTGCGNGVTAGVYVNGRRVDSVAIAGNDGTGVTRTAYANVANNDLIDVILSPRGADNSNADGCDGSEFRLVVDPTLPPDPRQPDGTIFIPSNAADTDGDGLADAWERQYAPNLTTLTGTGDPDGDGLNNVGEYTRDSDPTKADTDGDGLNDNAETKTGTFVSATNTGTNPRVADTDNDGLSDSAEVSGNPATDPNKADTDGDTFSDRAELQAGTNPNNATDNPLTFVIANSQAEFSGTQGQNGWSNGYRNFTLDTPEINYDPRGEFAFIPYAGGAGQGDWDGVSQMWTGTAWDLNTAATGPWTEQGALSLHPNGVNSAPAEEHWNIRRWVNTELTAETPVAIIWNVYKTNPTGDGVTGSLHINGVQVDTRTIAGTDNVGQVRRFYVNLKPGDIVDLAVTPEGVSNRNDGADGSASWFWVDTRLPAEPRQPDGTLFIPTGAADTDADGLPDFWERIFAPDLTTLNGTGDNDSDTLTNAQEFSRDSSPTDADTDDDGLSDAVETRGGTFTSPTNTGTNPRAADTDGDGLPDGAEVTTHTTNPNLADTDDDTFSDAAEIASGHNPKDATSNPNTSKIADSVTEFSGVQGQDGWRYGYRNYTTDGSGAYDTTKFIPFAGGEGQGEWDGVAQMWTGAAWDINQTANVGPWTEMAAQTQHPNGVNSAPNQEHWPIRRWVASELTAARPLALRYHLGTGGATSAALYINGTLVDSVSVAGNAAGVTRTFYANVNPGDIIDVANTPVGPDGNRADGGDTSTVWLQVDSVLPPNPTQPDGTPFVPGGGGTDPKLTITKSGDTLTITWTNGGTLYSAPTVLGPWNTTNDSDGTFTTTTGGTMQYFRVQR